MPAETPVPVKTHVRFQPWGNVLMIVPMSSYRHAVRWAGQDRKLSPNESHWLDPVTRKWLKVVPDTMFESHAAAYEAGCESPEPPGWTS